MKYERFSQLWDALVANRPYPKIRIGGSGMSDNTASTLIAYANGDKSQILDVKKSLGH